MSEEIKAPIGGPAGPGGPGRPGGPDPSSGDHSWMMDMMKALETAPLDPEYVYQILSPVVPEHTLKFWYEDGVLKGEHNTENAPKQEMMELKREGRNISWKSYAGSAGDEVFLSEAVLYPGGIMLGKSTRQDEGGPFPESPFYCKSKSENNQPAQPPQAE